MCDLNPAKIFDINLCGAIDDFVEADFSATCPGNCLLDWVYGPPANFSSAYFEVKSVKVFQTAGATIINNNSTPASVSSSTSSAPSQSVNSSSKSGATTIISTIGVIPSFIAVAYTC
jgi:hypothetical protein